jgi:hypothetical protein
MSPRCALAVLFLVLPLHGTASAQGSSFATGRVVYAGADAYTLVQRWDGRRGEIEVSGPAGSTTIGLDGPVFMAGAASASGVFIGTADGVRSRVRALFVPIVEGRFGRTVEREIDRPAGRDMVPVGAFVLARPDGFALWWQEASSSSANTPWQSYEARFDVNARASAPPRHLAGMMWPVADVAYVEPGSTFVLLYYGTGDPRGTRLCAVHIEDAGNAREHPWWASRPGAITEAQLVVRGGRAIAVYRGGDDGTRLLEVDVTSGNWGQEAAQPAEHGRIDANEIYGARADGSGLVIERAQPGRRARR